jgi:hypothetical protein
MVFSNVSE